jgi:hypothetical protein
MCPVWTLEEGGRETAMLANHRRGVLRLVDCLDSPVTCSAEWFLTSVSVGATATTPWPRRSTMSRNPLRRSTFPGPCESGSWARLVCIIETQMTAYGPEKLSQLYNIHSGLISHRRNSTYTAPAPPSDDGADANARTDAVLISISRTGALSRDTPPAEFSPLPWMMQTQRCRACRLFSMNCFTLLPASATVLPCRSSRPRTVCSPRRSLRISRRSTPGAT